MSETGVALAEALDPERRSEDDPSEDDLPLLFEWLPEPLELEVDLFLGVGLGVGTADSSAHRLI